MTESNVVPLEQTATDAPPHNAEIEVALLGALLVNNRAYEKVSDIVAPEHFYEPVHGRIYEAIGQLVDRNETASPLTLKHHFENDEALEQVGGGQYLFDLAASVVSVKNAPDYARTIAELAEARRALDVLHEAAAELRNPGLDRSVSSIVEETSARLDAGATAREGGDVVTLHDAAVRGLDLAEAAWKQDRRALGIPTGFRALDNILGGMLPGNLVIVAGRPSMGKTALALNIAVNAARAGYRCLFASLEMSAEELAWREQASLAAISVSDIRCGRILDDDMRRLIDVTEELRGLPLDLHVQGALTVASIRAQAKRHKRRDGLDLIVIDFLQLIRPSRESLRKANRVQEVSEITRELKGLAVDLGLPVIALSQLSRQVEQRDDKRPTLADLRDSGSIEQDADVVLFPYRHEYYLEKREPMLETCKDADDHQKKHADWATRMAECAGRADIFVAKQRNGPVGKARLAFEGRFTRFRDLADVGQEAML